MGQPIEAIVHYHFPHSADKVFECWLRPDLIRQWMGTALKVLGLPGEIGVVEVNARVGGSYCFSDKRPIGEAFHWGTYQSLEFPNIIAFTWNVGLHRENTNDEASVVTILIESTINGCDVSLNHSMNVDWLDYKERTESAWRNMLLQIDCLLSVA